MHNAELQYMTSWASMCRKLRVRLGAGSVFGFRKPSRFFDLPSARSESSATGFGIGSDRFRSSMGRATGKAFKVLKHITRVGESRIRSTFQERGEAFLNAWSSGRSRKYRLPFGNVRSCGKAEVGRGPGNGNLPLETFRLVDPNITKHLTARIRSKPEVQKISLNFRDVLEADLYGQVAGQ